MYAVTVPISLPLCFVCEYANRSGTSCLKKKKTRREGEQCRSDSPCVYKLKEKQLKVYKEGEHIKNTQKKKKEREMR